MAFAAQSVVDMATGRVGAPSVAFAALLRREKLNFAEVLAGGDCSSGVPQIAMRAVEDVADEVKAARHCLHDTLVSAFLRAYDAPAAVEHEAAFDPLLHRGAYALLRMAIIVMADCLA